MNKRLLFVLLHVLTLRMTASAQPLTLRGTTRDHAVLQRDVPLPFSGQGAPLQRITVTFAGQTRTVRSDAGGKWFVEFPAMPAGGPHELTVTGGDETIHHSDLLLGDVWLCAGQSNMAYKMNRQAGFAERMARADHPAIRFATLAASPSREAQSSLENVSWQVCTPETVGDFSGVAYHFATGLQKEIGVPVGVVVSARGGSFIESWMPGGAFSEEEALAVIPERWEWLDAKHEQLEEQQSEGMREWKRLHEERFKAWQATEEPGPFTPVAPRPPPETDSMLKPSALYNSAIHPVTLQPVKGVVWYQGESNTDRGYTYRVLLQSLIRHWRKAWNQPELPFVIVQLPNYDHTRNPYGPQDGGPWAVLRESQSAALELPHTSLAVTLGEGLRTDVHPPDKSVVGKRAALSALANVYGKDILGDSPRLKEHQSDESAMLLTFEFTGEGLRTLDGESPRGFQIAGADRIFVPAEAEITGPGRIRVSSGRVPRPLAVRHAWESNPDFNVVNSAGMPLSTFRTDDWEVPDQETTAPFSWLELK